MKLWFIDLSEGNQKGIFVKEKHMHCVTVDRGGMKPAPVILALDEFSDIPPVWKLQFTLFFCHCGGLDVLKSLASLLAL